MATVTKDELVSILMKRKGATIVSIEAETDARLRKKGNPHGSCRKLTNLVGMIGWIYANSINNQRAREGHTEHFRLFRVLGVLELRVRRWWSTMGSITWK
jgi:hypothetical protein